MVLCIPGSSEATSSIDLAIDLERVLLRPNDVCCLVAAAPDQGALLVDLPAPVACDLGATLDLLGGEQAIARNPPAPAKTAHSLGWCWRGEGGGERERARENSSWGGLGGREREGGREGGSLGWWNGGGEERRDWLTVGFAGESSPL